MSNSLSKMYLISPQTLEKFKSEELSRSQLDNEMKKILLMNKISDAKKWYLYRQQLMKFANKIRRNIHSDNINNNFKQILRNQNQNIDRKIKNDAQTQTKYYSKKDVSTATDPYFESTPENLYENEEYHTPSPMHSSAEFVDDNYEDYEGMDFNPDLLTSPTDRRRISNHFRPQQFNVNDNDDDHLNIATSKDFSIKRSNLKRSNTMPSQMVLNYPVRKGPMTRSQRHSVQKGNNIFRWCRFK